MGSDPLILAFDTSAAHCAAAVFERGHLRAGTVEPMARGQAEALVPLLSRLLAEAGRDLSAVTAIGVGVGPGNFTGLRISVATARGLALALDRPAIALTAFDLVRPPEAWGIDVPGAQAGAGSLYQAAAGVGAELVTVTAPRDKVYMQLYRSGEPEGPPRTIDPRKPPSDLSTLWPLRVRGTRSGEIAQALGAERAPVWEGELPWRLGAATAMKLESGVTPDRPAPLYVRSPDAAPPSDPPPRILP